MKLAEWLKTPLGQNFIEAEQKEIRHFLDSLFGYFIVLLGVPDFCRCILNTKIPSRIIIEPNIKQCQEASPIRARQDKLPVLSNGIDVIYLPHCLEFINNPHEVLRETYRALLPEGHVIISGFNPWSFWGILHFFSRIFKKTGLKGHFISINRLKDWLALLGFEILQIKKIANGNGYVILANKRVITLTPIRHDWQTEKNVISSNAIEPAAFE